MARGGRRARRRALRVLLVTEHRQQAEHRQRLRVCGECGRVRAPGDHTAPRVRWSLVRILQVNTADSLAGYVS